jgi:hypothetical protein
MMTALPVCHDHQDLPLTYTYAFIVGGDGGTEVALLTKSFLTAVTGITMPQVGRDETIVMHRNPDRLHRDYAW